MNQIFKNIDLHFDGNTSRDQLFVTNQKKDEKINIKSEEGLFEKQDNKNTNILTDNRLNFFFSNKNLDKNKENNNKNKTENLEINDDKKKRKSSLMSLYRKDPLIFLKSLKHLNERSSIYGKIGMKIKYCDILLSLLSIISFIVILIDNRIYASKSLYFLNEKINENEGIQSYEIIKQLKNRLITKSENILRIINIIISIFSIVILIIKYNYQLFLGKKEERTPDNKSLLSSKFLIIECLICLLIYPPYLNIVFTGVTFDNIYALSLNSIIFFFHIIKLYNIVRLIRAFSIFNTRISKTICETYKIELGLSFIIKSELNKRRLRLSLLIIIIICFIISILIKDFECFSFNKKTFLNGKKGLNDLQNILNTFWLTLVTITSVSYGDEYPRTSFGRILIFILSFFGLVSLGVIIATISEKAEFSPKEKKAFLKIKKIFDPDNKINKGANLIKTLLLLTKNFKSKNQGNTKSNFQEKIYLLLKLRTESKLFKNEFHVSRVYSMPIHDFVQTMENKLYYNLVDVTKHLEKLESIHEEFDIIKSNQSYINNKLKNIYNFQENICKYLNELYNENIIKNNYLEVENKKNNYLNLHKISNISYHKRNFLNNSRIKNKKKDYLTFLNTRYYHKKKKKNLNNNNKEKTKFFSSKFNGKRFVECFDYNNKLNLNSVVSINKKLNFYNFKSPVTRNKKFLLKEEIKKRKVKSYTEIRNLDLDHLDEKKSFEKINFKIVVSHFDE